MPGTPPQIELAGLELTLELLGETNNEAALAVLVPALDSPNPTIQQRSLQTLLARRSPVAQREVLRRLHSDKDGWRKAIGDGRGKLTQALRDAVLGEDPQLYENACNAIIWYREYDLSQALIAAAVDAGNEHAALASKTILTLADLLYEQLSGPRHNNDCRDPQLVREHVVASLENSMRHINRRPCRDIVAAFLTLAGRENTTLRQILNDPLHPTYLAVIDELTHQERPSIVRMLVGFLDDPNAPSSAIGVLTRRSDLNFVRHLLRKIGNEPSTVVRGNLKHVAHIAWLQGSFDLLDRLEEAAQYSVVKLLMASNVNHTETLQLIEHLLANGKVAGRCAAAEALVEFRGAAANSLTAKALADENPYVQAVVIPQLRRREIPGAVNRLVKLVDSRHEVVRKAAIESLKEFDYDRYSATFDLLDEDARKNVGMLVKKINPLAIDLLRAELRNPSRTKRLRALGMADAMDVVAELEPSLVTLAKDDDHLIRTAAVRALGACDTFAVRTALREALYDRSVIVQETAERSLQRLAQQIGKFVEPADISIYDEARQ